MLLVAVCAIAIGFQGFSIYKIESLIRRTNGKIRSRMDLNEVKAVININMMMAVVYIALFVLLIIILFFRFIGGQPFQAIGVLFLFGIITLPVGLIGKGFEKKIHSMEVESTDPELKQKFERYLVQWKEARFRLPD